MLNKESQRNYCTNVIQNEPDNPEGYINMCEVEMEENPQKALGYINKAIEIAPYNSNGYVLRADVYTCLSKNDTSVDHVEKSWSDFYEQAITDLTTALNYADDNKANILYKRGIAKLKAWDDTDAAEDFKASIDNNPNFMEPYFELAKLARGNADYIEAIEYFDKAIRIMPNNADLYYERGQAKEWSGNIEGAKEDYKKGLEINPECEYIENALNSIEIINQNDEEFNKQYNKITQYIIENPNDAEAYFNRGYLQWGHDVEDEIILSDFDKAIELNPNYVEAYQQRIYVFEHMGEYENLKKDYEKLIELEPTLENYEMYTRYLNTYFENGSQMALEVCNKMFEIFPASDTLYQLRGATYYNLKDYDNAIADYKKAIELNPKNAPWKRLLKNLEQEKNESF